MKASLPASAPQQGGRTPGKHACASTPWQLGTAHTMRLRLLHVPASAMSSGTPQRDSSIAKTSVGSSSSPVGGGCVLGWSRGTVGRCRVHPGWPPRAVGG
eukprot:45271-Chlamydomonas_euryale.AAC.1